MRLRRNYIREIILRQRCWGFDDHWDADGRPVEKTLFEKMLDRAIRDWVLGI